MNMSRWFVGFLFFSGSQIIDGAEHNRAPEGIYINCSSNNEFNFESSMSSLSNQEKKSHKEKLNKKNKVQEMKYPQTTESIVARSCQPYHCDTGSFILNMTKKEAVVVALAATYASMLAMLYGIAYTCQNYCPWAHWKHELSVRQLRKLPEKELATELFDVVNTLYESEHRQGDFLTPLVYFINAVDGEIVWHKRFLSLHAWLDYCLIFPKQQAAHKRVAEQYERLKFIRSILVAWLTSYSNDDMQHVAQ